MRRPLPSVLLPAALFTARVLLAQAQPPDFSGSAVFTVEEGPWRYQDPPDRDPVARLQQKLDRGASTLTFEPAHGYLKSVLEAFAIPVSSQGLVFSKTSLQLNRISPATPRAIYFNDDTYVGWVPSGDVIEVSAADPVRGGMFYTLEQKPAAKPRFVRRDDCLQCHASPKTTGVPGHLVRSVYADPEGFPLMTVGSFVTDHRSPFKERWGGWYVSGTHGQERHMGNAVVADPARALELDLNPGANLTRLSRLFDVKPYLSPHSDIVALMVLEHQTKLHNLFTRAAYEALSALSTQAAMNQALSRPPGELSDSTRRRLDNAATILTRYLLFADEVALRFPIQGTSGFADEFARRPPADSRGRSLRQFDLTTRMFRYPLSYLIYSESFDALPEPLLSRVLERLYALLSGNDQSPPYSRLDRPTRRAILEILVDTKPSLPAYWRAGLTPAAPAAP